MCNVSPAEERIRYSASTIDLQFQLEMTIEVPSVIFDEKKILEQLESRMFLWCKAPRIDKIKLAETLGMENRMFIDVKFADLTADKKFWKVTKYNAEGKVIPREE